MITDTSAIEPYRLPVAAHLKGRPVGAFLVPVQGFRLIQLKCVAHDGDEMDYFQDGISGPRFEHVSVSVDGQARLPTWDEMNLVKDLFWLPEETVVQFHPKKSEYVNANPLVLHLWKQIGVDHALPDRRLV